MQMEPICKITNELKDKALTFILALVLFEFSFLRLIATPSAVKYRKT